MSRGKASAAGARRKLPLPELKSESRAPSGPDSAPAPIQPRSSRSHVTSRGEPKLVMTAEQAQAHAARFRMVAYLCSEKPAHYHVGRSD